jgi:hypothetical protein
MKLSLALLSSVLFATTIVATPSRTAAQRNQERKDRRAGTPTIAARAETTTSYNWGGAILSAPPAGTTFTAVGASFVVPKISPPISGPGTWGGGAWVGIDGYTYDYAILQAGVNWDVTVSDTGVITTDYYAWYEWFPLTWQDYAMDVQAGDEITVWCQSNSNATGYCTITNGRTGIELTNVLSSPAPFLVLEGVNAEWIVEDTDDNGIVPFASFGSVTFTNCEAIANNVAGAWDPLYPNANNAVSMNMVQNGTVLTSVSYPGTNEVKVTYV